MNGTEKTVERWLETQTQAQLIQLIEAQCGRDGDFLNALRLKAANNIHDEGEIFLWENNPEQAWNKAQTGDCSAGLWPKLCAPHDQADPEIQAELQTFSPEPLIKGIAT